MVKQKNLLINIPNFLTFIRFILTPIIVMFIMNKCYLMGLLLFIIASITDSLDGFFARFLAQKSSYGSYLDPLADKCLINSSFIAFSMLNRVPIWLTFIIIIRDFMIILGVFLLHFFLIKFEMSPTIISKLTTIFQLMYILLLFLSLVYSPKIIQNYENFVFLCTIVLTICSSVSYFFKCLNFFKNENFIKYNKYSD